MTTADAQAAVAVAAIIIGFLAWIVGRSTGWRALEVLAVPIAAVGIGMLIGLVPH